LIIASSDPSLGAKERAGEGELEGDNGSQLGGFEGVDVDASEDNGGDDGRSGGKGRRAGGQCFSSGRFVRLLGGLSAEKDLREKLISEVVAEVKGS
jgi:hypothetical protein